MLVSPLRGEGRFAAAVAKRLQSLGALTQGDRSATVGAQTLGLMDCNFDTAHGTLALNRFCRLLLEATTSNTKRSNRPNTEKYLQGLPVLDAQKHRVLIQETISFLNNSPTLRKDLAFTRKVNEKDISFAVLTRVEFYKVDVSLFDGMSVPKFMNRLMGLQSITQNMIFDVALHNLFCLHYFWSINCFLCVFQIGVHVYFGRNNKRCQGGRDLRYWSP